MAMPSNSSDINFIAGVTKGIISWTEDKIKELLVKFRNREIAFVSDVEIIKTAREQRKTSEWELFKNYVDDSDLRILFQLGLALRKYEKDHARIEAIRQRIFKRYGTYGLHIAQFVQNGFFGKLLSNILERTSSPEELRREIKNLFENIETTVVFIQNIDDVNKKTEEIVIKIHANSPKIFIISSSRSAMKKCERICKEVMKRISGYTVEMYKTPYKEIYFLNKEAQK